MEVFAVAIDHSVVDVVATAFPAPFSHRHFQSQTPTFQNWRERWSTVISGEFFLVGSFQRQFTKRKPRKNVLFQVS